MASSEVQRRLPLCVCVCLPASSWIRVGLLCNQLLSRPAMKAVTVSLWRHHWGALLCSLCLLGKTFLDTAAAVVMVCFLKVRGLYACTHKCAPASKCRVPTSCLSTYHEQDGELDICTTSGVGIMPCHRWHFIYITLYNISIRMVGGEGYILKKYYEYGKIYLHLGLE